MPNIIHITKADDLSISNNQLVMIDEDNNDEKNKISLNDISAIVIENCHCKISAILQLRLVENNIPIIICNEKHQPEIHSLGLFNHFQVTLRINEQIEWEKEKKEKLWSRIVENKIENQRLFEAETNKRRCEPHGQMNEEKTNNERRKDEPKTNLK